MWPTRQALLLPGPALVAVAALLAAAATAAGAGTQLQKQVVAAGGGGSGATGYRLISTVGQPCVGRVTSSRIWHFVGFLSPMLDTASSIDEPMELPERVALAQNFPNPFRPLTTIRFDLPDSRHVRLEVFSMAGRRVTTLVDQVLSPGHLSVAWDGRDDRGRRVASGTYIYRLSAGDYTASERMVLTR